MHIRKIILTVAAALALVAGGTAAGAAIAGGPVSSSGMIDGCWTNAEVNGAHGFVLQDQGTACPKGTTAISWNQTGAAGQQDQQERPEQQARQDQEALSDRREQQGRPVRRERRDHPRRARAGSTSSMSCSQALADRPETW
jgi:hypothetical protein